MAYFAELDEDNIVISVHSVNNDSLDFNDEENSGISFLSDWSGKPFNGKQCSYNSNIRKNYPGPGYLYDKERDAFIPPKPFDSWNLDEETCRWKSPIPYPKDGNSYYWNELILNWEKISE